MSDAAQLGEDMLFREFSAFIDGVNQSHSATATRGDRRGDVEVVKRGDEFPF